MSHYNEEYFRWQKQVGTFGGIANLFKFKDYIKPDDRVIDFGCGGGYLLTNIKCKESIGIEISEIARIEAIENGINAVSDLNKIPDEWADVIISNHALEHVFRPLDELIALSKKLKKNGLIVFVVPHEKCVSYKPNNINQHLYTWSPMCAGNLFTTAGYTVERVETIYHKWVPYKIYVKRYLGQKGFDILCEIYGRLRRNLHQVRVVARKP